MAGDGPGPRARIVYDSLRSRILSGEYSPGERLPSQAVLAASFGVAALTLRQAIAFLQHEGLVSSEQGRGTFVRAVLPSPTPDEMIDASPTSIISLTADGRVTSWNPAAERMLGWTAEEVLGRPLPGIPDDMSSQFDAVMRAVASGETVTNFERRRVCKSGQVIDVSVDVAPTRDRFGTVNGMVATYTDITARKVAENALLQAEQRFRATFDRAAVGIAHTALDGSWLLVNQRLCDLYGRTREELMQLRFQDITHPDDLDADLAQLRRMLAGEMDSYTMRKRFLRKDGTIVWANLTISTVTDQNNRPEYVIAIIEDVSDRVRIEEQLAHRALHDPLTELPNRTLLADRLEQAILGAQRQHRPISLLLMDLDRFKEVNDTYGHQYGDQLLKELGARLAPLLRGSDTIGRLGGDEFAIILPGTDGANARHTARRLLRALDAPFEIEGRPFDIGGSIGAAVYPHHGADAGTLLRRADVAMYVAKRLNTGYSLYAPEDDRYSVERLSLVTDLHRAIERDELALVYQPKVDLRTGEVEGVEALLRWHHPERGLIIPDLFIPLAEDTRLIKPLTLWVVDRTLRQSADWAASGIHLDVAVNLSPRSLLDPEVIDAIVSSAARSMRDSNRLTVELTESAMMSDPQRAGASISRLHECGVRIAIDDFGTGYSSLARLRRLPVDQIKIDRSFVQEMLTSEGDCSIVRATISLGHDLDIQAVAEGVESREVYEKLKRLGCDIAQGFYISRPMPPEQLPAWLATKQRKVA